MQAKYPSSSYKNSPTNAAASGLVVFFVFPLAPEAAAAPILRSQAIRSPFLTNIHEFFPKFYYITRRYKVEYPCSSRNAVQKWRGQGMTTYRIGIDLGGTNIKSAVFDSEFQLLLERSDPTEAIRGPGHVLHLMKTIIKQMLRDLAIDQNAVLCMGMGIPGLLDPQEGRSIFSPNFPQWEDIHVVREMQSEFSFPVWIDNDVRVNLYGEWLFGAGRGYRNIVLLTLGTGVGSGIVADGRVLYGHTSSAGELGHMNMYREGRPCRCGSSGCLGRYVSATGMVQSLKEELEAGQPSIISSWIQGEYHRLTSQLISEAYDQGDALAIEVMHETGRLLGFGLSNVINLLNPELLIIGGGMSAAGDRLLHSVRDTIGKHALKLSSQGCAVVQASLGSRAGMVGAAAYAHMRISR
ncbi:ROK family protein [Paenibacillus caseinilyticus]|uniref:ROK family protein n=1 Tax=Paenibacillus caseinilyticus TaxID=3098138 RepID=UPI0022B88973|nr:ROK family protein [Paenibacillus caseinilyticus]